MIESNQLLRIGDIISIHAEVKNTDFIISSKSYIPSIVTLSINNTLEPYESYFKIERPKTINMEEYPNPDDDTQPQTNSQDIQEVINFDQPIIFIHYLSGRYLAAKQSEGQHINLVVSEQYRKACQFKLMPMFRCQTLGCKKIRQSQEVILRSLNFEDNQGNYNLSVFSGSPFTTSSTKSDISSIKINRRGFIDSPNQLYFRRLYKINNIQIDRNLLIINNVASFFQPSSQLQTMFYFVLLKNPNSMSPIQQDDTIYVRSIRYQMFLELHGGEFRLTDKTSKAAEFRLIQYRNTLPHVLMKDAVLVLLNIDSGRYLSFQFEHQKGDFISKPSSKFDLKDTLQIVPVSQSSIRECFFIYQFKNFLSQFLDISPQRQQNFRELLELKNVLYQMLIFLFNQTKAACELLVSRFFQLQTIKSYSSENQAILMDQSIGVLVYKILEIMVTEYRKQNSQLKIVSQGKKTKKLLEKDDIQQKIQLYSQIIKLIHVLIVGMCKNKIQKTKLLLQFHKCIFNNLQLDLGGIECIIHVFKDNKEFLRLLQGDPHTSEYKSYIHLLISHIKKIPKTKIGLAIKIVQLFKCLVIANNSEPVKMNQTIIGQQFSLNKLQFHLFSELQEDDEELKVLIFDDSSEKEQIMDMYSKKSKYSLDLVLVQRMLMLYSYLCAGRNYLNLDYFKQKFSLKMVLRYINNYSTEGSLKNCFLNILLHVYLDSLPRTLYVQNNIICIEQGRKLSTYEAVDMTDRLLNKDTSVELEMKQISFHSYEIQLQETRDQLMKNMMQQLASNKFTESSYMILQILHTYLIFNMFDQQSKIDFRKSLMEFICSNSEIDPQYKQKIYFLMIKILLKFQEYTQEQNCKTVAVQLFSNPKKANDIFSLLENVIGKSRKQEQQKNLKFINTLLSFTQQFKEKEDVSFTDLTLDLIKRKMLAKHVLVRKLKSIILIEEPEMIQLYKRCKDNIMVEIELQTQKFSISLIRSDKNLMNQSVRKLNQSIEEINIGFTLQENDKKRYQFMVKQLGIHNIILNFLVESINDLKPDILEDSYKIYKSAFKFLVLFIDNNKTNLKIVTRWVNDLKKYIVLPQMGQSHFFFMLAKLESIKFKIQESIVPVVLENLPNNIYLTCIMLEYCKKQNLVNVKFIDKISKRFLSDQSLFTNILMMKKNRGTIDLALSQRKPIELIYYTQLFKLLNLMFEFTTDKKYLIEMAKRYITLETILRALNQNDIFDERNDSAFVYTFLQKELIKCGKFLKLNETKFKKDNYELVEVFLQKSLKKLHFYSEDTQNDKQNYIGGFLQNYSTQIHDILLITQDFKNNELNFQKNLNFVMFITNYLGPWVGDLFQKYLQNENGQLNQLSKKEMQLLQDSFSKKLKQSVYDMLTKYDYDRHAIDYTKAIGRCEEVFKIKIKLPFVPNRERKQTLINEEETNEIIQDGRLELVLHFYKLNASQKQVKMYKSIFNIIHQQNTRQILHDERDKFSKILSQIVKDKAGFLDLLSNSYIAKLSKNRFDKNSDRKSLRRVIMFIRLIILGSNTKQTQLRFINNKIGEYTIRWCSQAGVDPSIHCKLIVLLSELLLSSNQQNSECQDKVIAYLKQMQVTSPFFQKFKTILLDEIIVYSNLIFNEKRRDKVISEDSLSYQYNKNPQSLSLVVSFLTSLIQGPNSKNKQFVGYTLGFMEIMIQLLRSIIKFVSSFNQNNRAYYCLSSHKSINLILESMLHFVNYQPTSNIQLSIEKNFIPLLMDILAMNDFIRQQQQTHSKSSFQLLEDLAFNCHSQPEKKYLKEIYNTSKHSLNLYKDLSKFYNPFIPTQPNYLRAKTAVIRILSELIHLQNKQQQAIIFKSLSQSTIKLNIISIYSKHIAIYGNNYEVFAFDNKLKIFKEPPTGRMDLNSLMEDSNYIQNGFNLVYVLRKTESHRQIIDKEIQDLKKKNLNSANLLQPIRQVVDFCRDCATLFKRCFKCCSSYNKKINCQSEDISTVLRFFLQNSGRVQIIKNQTLYAIDFPIMPECVRKQQMEKEYLDEVDLTSVQSKSESILKYSTKFVLLYQNQQRYKVKYKSLPFIDLLLQHINLFKNISFIIIIILNLLILINHRRDINKETYTQQFALFYEFIVLQMCISYILLIFFLLKQMPLIILQVNKAIQIRRNTYGSNFNTYPKIVQYTIRVWMFIAQPELLYHILFTAFVTVSFFIPVFVAVLLLDIFIRIPLLRRILMSIWRPKIQIILALVAFILIEYYFSILLFFSFQERTYGYCSTLQDCFSFVYFVTYKVVGGFPGFLFQFKEEGNTNFQVDGFSVFEDIYMVVVFEIFFAVLIGIIIDNFSILRTQQDQRKYNLSNYCLICGVNKAVINQSNTKTNFLKHIREDHNIWNYFYYFTYVNKKPDHKKTQLEKYISKCLENKSSEWLPLNYINHLHSKF